MAAKDADSGETGNPAPSESGYGWTDFGQYFDQKKQKLFEQNEKFRSSASSTVLKDLVVYIDGLTCPPAHELKKIILANGGYVDQYPRKTTITHIIASNLTIRKFEQWANMKVVTPEFILDSIKAGKVLPWTRYRLVLNSASQPRISNFGGASAVSGKSPTKAGPASLGAPNAPNATNTDLESTNVAAMNADIDSAIASKDSGEVETTDSKATNSVNPAAADEILVPASGVLVPESDDEKIIMATMAADAEVESDLVQRSDLPNRPSSPSFRQNRASSPVSLRQVEKEAIVIDGDDEEEKAEAELNDRFKSKAEDPMDVDLESPQNHASPGVPQPDPERAPASSTTTPTKQLQRTNPTETASGSASPTTKSPNAPKSIHPELQSDWARQNSSIAPDFLEKFYGNSRLHHISTAKTNMQEFVRRETSNLPKRPPNPNGMRTVMHVDMDCFFVSVAITSRPEVEGKPAAVCHARNTGSSTHSEIASCNYPARAFGLRNGMWTGEARKKCPELVMLPYEFEKYTAASEAFYRVLIKEADEIQANSVDEAFIDVSSRVASRGEGQELAIAEEIRRKVKEATGVNCSIGIGESMLAARMATKKAKPDGAFFLAQELLADHLTVLAVDELPGVGRETAGKLGELGIRTCGDLRNAGKGLLQRELGEKTGQQLYDFARGVDTRRLKQDAGPRKTVSAEANWGVRFEEVAQAEKFVADLSKEVAKRMHEANVRGKSITLRIRKRNPQAETIAPKSLGCGWSDAFTRTVTLLKGTSDGELIGKECVNMFRAMAIEVLEIRGLGIQVAKLEPADGKRGEGKSIVELFGNVVAKGKEVRREEGEGSGSEERPAKRARSESVQPVERADIPAKSVDPFAGAKAVASRSNLVPQTADQIDEDVLKELPPELQAEILRGLKQPPRPGLSATGINPFARTAAAKPKPSAPSKPAPAKSNALSKMMGVSRTAAQPKRNPAVILRGQMAEALPSPSQVDPEVFAAMPDDVKEELKRHWNALKRPLAGAHAAPLKRAKTEPAAVDKASNSAPAPAAVAPKESAGDREPDLMGKTDPDDVRTLIREWIGSCPDDGPMDEDRATFEAYCGQLLARGSLDAVESVVSYLARHGMDKQGWKSAVEAIVGNVQVLVEKRYGNTSAVLASIKV